MRNPGSFVNGRVIFRQLKADLIGKDSYRGVTLSYTWLANQFGHYGLGYIPTLGVYQLIRVWGKFADPVQAASLLVSAAWLIFETYNFLGPLLFHKQSSSRMLFVPSRSRFTFQPSWGNIAFDTITDLGFFWLGSFSAGFFLHPSWLGSAIILVIAVLLLYPSYFWYTTKIYEQAAVYPFQFRLSQWDLAVSNQTREIIVKYVENRSTPTHLLVFGGRNSGKTSLGVALANEFSIRRHPCTYTTATKLYLEFFESEDDLIATGNTLWTWRSNSLLIIDDINPGKPVRKDIVGPSSFLELINTYGTNEVNIETLRNKKVIWIMGDYERSKDLMGRWAEMLTGMGVKREHIFSVDLSRQSTIQSL